MFERFTTEARTVVAGSQDEARALRDPFKTGIAAAQQAA